MSIKDYNAHIDRLARQMDGSTVLNGSAEHAAVINERMFNYAQSTMDIVTRQLDPRVYGTEDLVSSAKLFLGMPERRLRIAVENAPVWEDHPLVSELVDYENFEIRTVGKPYHETVNVNFTLMDGSSYRFERDKTKAVAIACFGDKGEFPGQLSGLFDQIWNIAEPMSLNTLHATA